MNINTDPLLEIVTTLTDTSHDEAARALTTNASADGDRAHDRDVVANLVRQAPARHDDRVRLLAQLEALDRDVPASRIRAAGTLLRTRPVRFPRSNTRLAMPALDPPLTDAMRFLLTLDRSIADPWTLVGGLMVLAHCVEHHVPFMRVTGDADLVVGVFTRRAALTRLTAHLAGCGFTDATPPPLAGGRPLSYRWTRDQIIIDLLVPDQVNAQDRVPLTVNARSAVSMPATQQALARTERVAAQLHDGSHGYLRRPNLAGALVMKAAAATADQRDPHRHRADVVALSAALASSGEHITYSPQLRRKDVARLRRAYQMITDAEWRNAPDPVAAREALLYLTEREPPT